MKIYSLKAISLIDAAEIICDIGYISKGDLKMSSRRITISRLTHPEASGDWHDKPLRWAVTGPGDELQKFPTRKEAQKYKSIRFQSYDQKIAADRYVREG